MFTLGEVISITLVVSVIVGYLAYQLAEFNMIARILGGMSDSELDRLEHLKDKLETAVDDAERDQILESASSGTVTLTQEIVNGVTYLYNGTQFVAQGSTASEAAANFYNSHHSSLEATVVCSEGRSYRIIGGKIDNLNHQS